MKASSNKKRRQPAAQSKDKPVTIRKLAKYLKLSQAAVSMVINRVPRGDRFPEDTRERIFAAAKKFNYRPNFFARSLRNQQTFTIGVLVPELSEGYAALVLAGIEDYLLQAGYFFLVISHRHRKHQLEHYLHLLMDRLVEGIITVDTILPCKVTVPTVAVSGHKRLTGVTNLVLDHAEAGMLAMRHLKDLGHTKIAFIKGQPFSTDTDTRWSSIRAAARKLDLEVDEELVTQLEVDSASPEVGYDVTKALLKRGRHFTAIFAFNDISGIGAMRALLDSGIKVPEEVSVMGFDDIEYASYQNPRLTTIRQPLRRMGELAAETLINRVKGKKLTPKTVCVQPELVIRESTARACSFNAAEAASAR